MNTALKTSDLESGVQAALEKGFLATFIDIMTSEGADTAKSMASKFAAAAAPDMATAIEEFVKTGAVVHDGPDIVHTFTVVGTCAVGAVAGTATGTLSQPMKME